jgi:hypothetical protein
LARSVEASFPFRDIPKWDIEMDAQLVEIIGRNRLINELLTAGLEVALPMRDRGIDLIAYADVGERLTRFAAIPIQMKAASGRSFSIFQKYAKFPNLLIAFVWGLGGEVAAETYALTHDEAVAVGNTMGWTKTPSWARAGYSTTQPGKRVRELLKPYLMTSDAWRRKILRLQTVGISSSLRYRFRRVDVVS